MMVYIKIEVAEEHIYEELYSGEIDSELLRKVIAFSGKSDFESCAITFLRCLCREKPLEVGYVLDMYESPQWQKSNASLRLQQIGMTRTFGAVFSWDQTPIRADAPPEAADVAIEEPVRRFRIRR